MDEIQHNHQTDASLEDRLQALLEKLSAYVEQYHGGWVRMVDYQSGILRVQMGGACDGCSLSEVTLHGWVGGTIKQFFPEVEQVIAI
jgi:Fe-S cluster biogenesis protein NfuA